MLKLISNRWRKYHTSCRRTSRGGVFGAKANTRLTLDLRGIIRLKPTLPLIPVSYYGNGTLELFHLLWPHWYYVFRNWCVANPAGEQGRFPDGTPSLES